jgi:hypothetical protein
MKMAAHSNGDYWRENLGNTDLILKVEISWDSEHSI